MKIGNIECYGVIYKITNLVNNKCYIGQTTVGFNKRYSAIGKGIERVYNYHERAKQYEGKYNDYLLKSIKKYGFNCWEIIKIYDIAFSKEELDIKEIMYIKQFDCINNGYNHVEGGKNGKLSEETKRKIGENTKRMWENMTEEKINEMKEKIGKSNRERFKNKENHPFYGKHHSEETKQKMSEVKKGKNNANSKMVICLTTKETFYCANEASECYNITSSAVQACCTGICRTGGRLEDGTPLVWRYYEDYLNMSEEEIQQIIENVRIPKTGDNSPKARSVICITTGKIFLSVKSAGDYYNVCRSNIGQCCKGRVNNPS